MEVTPEEQQIPITKPRKPFVAFLLSLFFAGLGQIYNGQFKKGFIFLVITFLLPLIFGWTRWILSLDGLIAICIIEIAFRIYIIVDAVKNAKRQQNYIPKNYNTWYKHLFLALLIFTAHWFFDSPALLGVKTFNIVSTANNPTLQVNDRFVADMRAYDNSKPDYGDLIVFENSDGKYYPGRIVGLPNDKLEIINDIVSVNGKLCKTNFIKESTMKFSVEGNIENVAVLEMEEEFPNQHKHHLFKLKQPFDSTKTIVKDIFVPSDCYYFLGDNRDNALDSRFIGPIRMDQIEGKIIYSYWGETKQRINIDFRDK